MSKYFSVIESADADKYVVLPNENNLPSLYTRGSRLVFGARVLNTSYADYCRICRDVFGAKLVGKNNKYVVPYFYDKVAANKFSNFMSDRMCNILKSLEDNI